MRTNSTTPGGQHEVVQVLGEVMHPHLGTSYHPTVGVVIASIQRVVGGNVLEITRRRIESQAALWSYIAESHAALT
jgi:hypothetical protein